MRSHSFNVVRAVSHRLRYGYWVAAFVVMIGSFELSAETGMVRCEHCNNEQSAENVYCESCGKKMIRSSIRPVTNGAALTEDETYAGVPSGSIRGLVQIVASPLAYAQVYWVACGIVVDDNPFAPKSGFEKGMGCLVGAPVAAAVVGSIECVGDAFLGSADILTLGWSGKTLYENDRTLTPYILKRGWRYATCQGFWSKSR